jgi:histidinol-phosphate aminotransferase
MQSAVGPALPRRWVVQVGLGLTAIGLGGAGNPTPANRRIRLGLNENAWGPSPRVAPAIEAALGRVNRYVEAEHTALIEQIADLEGVAASQVLLGEVLAPLGFQIALQGDPGGRFIHSTPGYAGFTDAARLVGGEVIGVPLNARLENDLPALLAAIDAGAKALFLVNPHNPSGTVNDPAELFAFLREASRRTLVIVDEAYLEFCPDFDARTATNVLKEGGDIVIFRTLAKAYGLAGLQAGYALAPPALTQALRARGVGAPRSQDQLTLAAASAALADRTHLTDVAVRTERERLRWHAALDAKGWPRSDARGNFIFFRADRPQVEIAAQLAAFDVDIGRAHPPLEDWTRISIGLPEENRRVRQLLQLEP